MTWSVELDDRARRELRKLDPSDQKQILRYLRERIATPEDRATRTVVKLDCDHGPAGAASLLGSPLLLLRCLP